MGKLMDAVKVVNLKGRITDGRTGIGSMNLAKTYPKGIHINRVEVNPFEANAENYICTFDEAPDKYFTSTTVLTQKLDNLIDAYEGDLTELNRDLAETPLLTILKARVSKAGKNYVDALFVIGAVTPEFETFDSVEIEDIPVDSFTDDDNPPF